MVSDDGGPRVQALRFLGDGSAAGVSQFVIAPATPRDDFLALDGDQTVVDEPGQRPVQRAGAEGHLATGKGFGRFDDGIAVSWPVKQRGKYVVGALAKFDHSADDTSSRDRTQRESSSFLAANHGRPRD